MYKVSVIVPVYNVGNYLDSCIRSVLRQTLNDVELILVNDGSTDNSKTIIDKYSSNHTNIKTIHKQNEGVTISRNKGLAVAEGEYVLFLDGDDFLEENALERMYSKAKETNSDWIVGDYILRFPNGSIVEKKFYDFGVVDNLRFLSYCYSQKDFYYTGRLIRRDFITKAEINVPSQITFGEDNIIVTQLASQVNRAAKVNDFVLNYVQRATSVTNQLKKKDLEMRAMACRLCYDYLVHKGFYNTLKGDIDNYFQCEIASFIIRGYYDDNVNYIKLQCKSSKEHLSIKNRLVLLVSSIHPMIAIQLCELLRLFRKK